MLCNKIEIHESDCFTQTRASIHILALLSDSYIEKKPSGDSVTRIYTEFINFVFLPAIKL